MKPGGRIASVLMAGATSACSALAQVAPAGPMTTLNTGDLAITEVTRSYEVSGDTPRAVRDDMNAKRPTDQFGKRFDAYTGWTVNWKMTFDESETRCAIKTANVTVTLTITIPQLADRAPPDVRTQFDRYIEALLVHERGHADTGRDVGRDISAGLIRLPPQTECGALRATAGDFAMDVVREGNKRDLEIDESTRHGASQGAVFP